MTLSNNEIKQLEEKYELDVYPKRGISIVKGEGTRVWDADGNEYLDFASGIGVASIGHSNPELIDNIIQQMRKIITVPEIFHNDTRAKLLEKLINISPNHLSKVFLCNSGTEAVEAAFKFARLSTGKKKVISAMRGFHGRTMGSLSATFNPKYRKPFNPLLDGFSFVPFNKFDRLKNQVEKNENDTAAVILECIQGNGGINIATKEYLQKVQNLCNENNILLIIDEVQTGFCRTGTFFSFEQYEIQPDIVTVAKAMGGGVPIGAVLCTEKIEVSKNLHGSTFGGNPLAAAAALSTIDYLTSRNIATQAEEKGTYLVKELKNRNIELIRDIRYRGLMIGIECKHRVYTYLQKLMDNGILALPAGSTVIRLLPPLTVDYDEIDHFVDIFSKVLSD